MLKKISDVAKKVDEKYMDLTLRLTLLSMGILSVEALSNMAEAKTIKDEISLKTLSSTVTWPWERFLGSLAEQLSGPLPRILGVLGIVGCAVALFAGNGGAGTQKFIMLIFAISIALFAPTFISWLNDSGGGATIDSVFGSDVSSMVDSINQVLR